MGEAMEKVAKSQPESVLWWGLRYCHWGSKTMISGTWNKMRGSLAPGRSIVSGWACVVVLFLLVLCAPSSFAGRLGGGRGWMHRAQAAHPARVRPAPVRPQVTSRPAGNGNANANGAARPAQNNPAEIRPGVGRNAGMMGPGMNGGARPGHLGEWMYNHRNLSPQQQEEELRREPGFNRLSPEMQQRVLNRLRTLDARPPAQQQRILQRNEMFESLPPERKADVRSSAQALTGMAPDRQRMVRQAFVDLRQIPPEQRGQILNSARFSNTFTPDERHVLGSLLSIEPYEPR
jgi:hypothetical protein